VRRAVAAGETIGIRRPPAAVGAPPPRAGQCGPPPLWPQRHCREEAGGASPPARVSLRIRDDGLRSLRGGEPTDPPADRLPFDPSQHLPGTPWACSGSLARSSGSDSKSALATDFVIFCDPGMQHSGASYLRGFRPPPAGTVSEQELLWRRPSLNPLAWHFFANRGLLAVRPSPWRQPFFGRRGLFFAAPVPSLGDVLYPLAGVAFRACCGFRLLCRRLSFFGGAFSLFGAGDR